MFTVSPIGSCRITTPLRNGQSRHGFALNMNRCYGYCHSPAEAVQLANFMRGGAAPPADVWPLISRSYSLGAISAQRHNPSHLYVVELASAKELTIDGVSIQLNYLRLVFSDFFSDPVRAQGFWECAASEDKAVLSDFLKRNWSANDKQIAQSERLGRIRLSYVTRSSLKRDLLELAEILPRLLFVSHVNARKPDGATIGTRSSFIDLVREEVTALGLDFYDPTDLMEAFGQPNAIEDESTGLAHFTPEFGDAIMDEWMHRFMAPATDRLVVDNNRSEARRVLVPQVDAAVRAGRFADIGPRLEALAKESVEAAELLEGFNTKLVEAQSDFRSVARAIASADSDDIDVADLIADAGRLGLFDIALDLAARSKGGFQALPTRLLVELGTKALNAGEIDDAFEFALAAYGKSPTEWRSRDLLVRVALRGEFNILGDLTCEQVEDVLSHIAAEARLRLLDIGAISPCAVVSGTWAPAMVAELAGLLSRRDEVAHAIELVALWNGLQSKDRSREEPVSNILDEWVVGTCKRPNGADKMRALAHLFECFPTHPQCRQAMRDARLDLVDRMRSFGKDGDFAALEALAPEVQAQVEPLPEFDLWRARLRFDRGDYEEVLKLGPVATDFLSERIGVWVLLMRAALNANKSGEAKEFASRVVRLACSKTEKLRAEAEAVLGTQTVGT